MNVSGTEMRDKLGGSGELYDEQTDYVEFDDLGWIF